MIISIQRANSPSRRTPQSFKTNTSAGQLIANSVSYGGERLVNLRASCNSKDGNMKSSVFAFCKLLEARSRPSRSEPLVSLTCVLIRFTNVSIFIILPHSGSVCCGGCRYAPNLSTSTPSPLQCLRTFSTKPVDDSSVPWGAGTSAATYRSCLMKSREHSTTCLAASTTAISSSESSSLESRLSTQALPSPVLVSSAPCPQHT